ncbi:hypothetical protein ABK046_48980, partial [Streptomyces caeruleatus]
IDFTATPSVTLEALNVKWDKLVASGQMSVENEGEMLRYFQSIMANPDLKTNFGKGYDMYLEMMNVHPPTKATAANGTKDYDPLS